MKKELQAKLLRKYPKIFNKMTTGSIPSEIRCPDSWYSIIDTLCEQIQHYTNRMQNETKQSSPRRLVPSRSFPNTEILQIKEKFGELRVYTSKSDQFINGLITMACAVVRKIT